MTVDETYQTIAKQKPDVVYVSGKASTGKSTFGRKLRDNLKYKVIEIESVLLDIIKEHRFEEQHTFRKVLYETEASHEKTLFLTAIRQMIAETVAQDQPVVIEGAIANIDTLKEVLEPAQDLYFVYFHPEDLKVYNRYLTKRFMHSGAHSYAGLPLTFWHHIDDQEFKQFCKTRALTTRLEDGIKKYAELSQRESLMRLDEFKHVFQDIKLVKI